MFMLTSPKFHEETAVGLKRDAQVEEKRINFPRWIRKEPFVWLYVTYHPDLSGRNDKSATYPFGIRLVIWPTITINKLSLIENAWLFEDLLAK